MQKKYKKLLLSLVITSIVLFGCSSPQPPIQHNLGIFYNNNSGSYNYCNSESCPSSTQFTLDEEEEPIYFPEIEHEVVPKEIKDVVVNFAFNRYVLTNKEKQKIKLELKNIELKKYDIEIIGYTDDVTSKKNGYKYNKKLALNRAATVANYVSSTYKINRKSI